MKRLLLAALREAIVILGFLALLHSGCNATPTYTEGIPHLLKVDGVDNLWRSGQPPNTLKALDYIAYTLRIGHVIGLNSESEGNDDIAFHRRYGTALDYLPIPPSTRPESPATYTDILAGPTPEQWQRLASLAREVRAHPETRYLVHCVNGNDRTGAFVGLVLALGCEDLRDVYRYMLSTGFHWQLAGLANGWWQTATKLQEELQCP